MTWYGTQAITLKLKSVVELDEVERLIRNHNEWVDFVPNTKEETLQRLTPCAIAGGLKVAVGRCGNDVLVAPFDTKIRGLAKTGSGQT
jgi:aspartate-semialdehyde dehydrogenase